MLLQSDFIGPTGIRAAWLGSARGRPGAKSFELITQLAFAAGAAYCESLRIHCGLEWPQQQAKADLFGWPYWAKQANVRLRNSLGRHNLTCASRSRRRRRSHRCCCCDQLILLARLCRAKFKLSIRAMHAAVAAPRVGQLVREADKIQFKGHINKRRASERCKTPLSCC